MGNPNDKMEDYRSYVQAMAKVADGKELILNRTPDHAAIIVSNIFGKAQSMVEIVSGKLDDHVWGVDETIEKALEFLNRGEHAKLRIIVEQDIDRKSNLFLSAVRAAGLMAHVKLFRISDEAQKQYTCHFMVADGTHYRFQDDRSKFEAIIQFGNQLNGEELRGIFASLRSQSQEIESI